MGILFVLLSLVSTAATLCPIGYSYYNMTQKCYKAYQDASPYFAAADVCRQDDAWLVSIHNAFENTYIANLVSNSNLDHWIGLTNMMSGYDFEWLDNSPLNYANWVPGQPNYDASCVLMKSDSASWTSQTCRYFLPFICEYDPAAAHSNCPTVPSCPTCPTETQKTCSPAPICPTVTPHPTCPACPTSLPCPTTPTCPPPSLCPTCPTCPIPTQKICPTVLPAPTCPPPTTCPTCPTPTYKTCPTVRPCPTQPTPAPKPLCDAGWVYYGSTHSCYFVGAGAKVTNSQAQHLCRNQGADLASVHSAAENTFIYNYLYANGIATSAWLGLYRTSSGISDFANYDGTPVDYTYWCEGNPDNWNNVQYCVNMCIQSVYGYPDATWDDFNCAQLYPYVCKKPANK